MRPLGSYLLVLLKNEQVLLLGPLLPDDVGVEHVVPPFAALAPEASRDVPLDDHPVLDTELFDFLPQKVVLFLSPLVAFGGLIIGFSVAAFAILAVELAPPLEASDLGLVGHESAKPVP